jgi:Fe-S-cluster containining protein
MPQSPEASSTALRLELRALYAEADAALEGWACECSGGGRGAPRCCRFATTGREPYPTVIELLEVQHAISAAGLARRSRRTLPLVDGACPLLSESGRCLIYASRPFGCRTFFCTSAEGPQGPRSKLPRDTIHWIARRIADLSARFDPRDPQPRPFRKALATILAAAGSSRRKGLAATRRRD